MTTDGRGPQLGALAAIEASIAPVEQPEAAKVDPADGVAMERMFQAFGTKQMGAAARHDSIFRRLHAELARTERRDGGTKVVTATNRAQRDPRLGSPSGTFRMQRDWDPTDPDNKD